MDRMTFSSVLVGALLVAAPAIAQAPPPATAPPAPPPPPVLSGNVSFGLGITSGNSDTTNINAGYEFKYAPPGPNVVKSSGLLLYGKTDGVVSTEQYGLSIRDEYSLNPRTFVFGEARYLHDRFKGIEYVISPTGGLGYKVVAQPKTELSVSGGFGGFWEKDYDVDRRTCGAVTFEEKLTVKPSPTVSIGESVNALWNIKDFGDGLYVFRANLAAGLVGNMQLKIELADTYKTKLPPAIEKKNDVTLIMALVYKF
jgi:putative salt-induced outer membrane protein